MLRNNETVKTFSLEAIWFCLGALAVCGLGAFGDMCFPRTPPVYLALYPTLDSQAGPAVRFNDRMVLTLPPKAAMAQAGVPQRAAALASPPSPSTQINKPMVNDHPHARSDKMGPSGASPAYGSQNPDCCTLLNSMKGWNGGNLEVGLEF